MERATKQVVGLLVIAGVILSVAQFGGFLPGTAAAGTEVVSASVDGDLPATDPSSSLWDDATAMDVPISAQLIIKPRRSTTFVDSVEVRSLNNATHIAFRVTWADTTKDEHTTSADDFRDAVAIQIADAGGTPPVCMGSGSSRMHIMHWKADWQADIEGGFHDLEDEFPNFWVDTYPFLLGGPPYIVPDNFTDEAKLYLVGWEVGNPFSEPLKVTAVEDAIAHGFSTITTQESQDALGRGEWSANSWSVVVSREKNTGDGVDTVVGDDNVLAFAVWDGTSEDVGSRKSTSAWVPLVVEGRESPGGDLVVPLFIALIVALAIIALIPLVRRRKPAEEEMPEEPEEVAPEEITEEPPEKAEEEKP
jgi:hypothetical protein